ncbi:hypothetical protein [Colwellia sp. MB02u-9]|uniref:hypothetical protein n=1 Tax=Colwellia sp. MB02u-9 TaxID=2759823 RepID=UPI0015F63E44|nr:hypothetical protein [Colwellia sp. MB02u-9]MBA6296129.1 hypothetical protein [Colwellia sp. MB02u-9]
MEDDKLELEAFSSFNSRYFKLASKIDLILNKDEGQYLTDEEKEILDEYFYFKKGRISLDIWRNWAHGISATVRSHELIQNYWNKTVRNKVNYGLTLKEVEKYLK